MRFLLKIAFLLGLAALFLPSAGGSDDRAEPGLSPVVLFYGAQQAISDLGGFCGRAPAACASGQEAMRFAGERIGDGVALAYAYATGHSAPQPQTPAESAPVRASSPAIQPPPRAYKPPVGESTTRRPASEAPSIPPRQKAPARPGTDPVTTAAVERGPMPGSAKPFRMPAMAGGANRPPAPHPSGIVPPARPPLPQTAPRA